MKIYELIELFENQTAQSIQNNQKQLETANKEIEVGQSIKKALKPENKMKRRYVNKENPIVVQKKKQLQSQGQNSRDMMINGMAVPIAGGMGASYLVRDTLANKTSHAITGVDGAKKLSVGFGNPNAKIDASQPGIQQAMEKVKNMKIGDADINNLSSHAANNIARGNKDTLRRLFGAKQDGGAGPLKSNLTMKSNTEALNVGGNRMSIEQIQDGLKSNTINMDQVQAAVKEQMLNNPEGTALYLIKEKLALSSISGIATYAVGALLTRVAYVFLKNQIQKLRKEHLEKKASQLGQQRSQVKDESQRQQIDSKVAKIREKHAALIRSGY